MLKSKSSLILGAALVCALISLTCSRVIDINGGLRDTWFFKKLSITEQRALISLAIAYHDVPESANDTAVFPTNPLPIRPKAEEVPATLFTALMNGQVPKHWMRNFIRYLQTRLYITEESFLKFRNAQADVLCTRDGKCYDITDVGQQCCPFG